MTAQQMPRAKRLDIEPLVEYWAKDLVEVQGRVELWNASLDDLIEHDQLHRLRYVRTADQVRNINPRLFNLIYSKVCIIPPRGNRCAGLAVVDLSLQIANALGIMDTVSYDLVSDIYDMQKRNIPIQRGTSFRVTKSRLTT